MVGGERDVELGDDLEHGDAVVEAVDGVGWVDDGDEWVARGEDLELDEVHAAGGHAREERHEGKPEAMGERRRMRKN